MQPRTTIKDVARLAEVSISTVSRVLNDTCPVGEDKRIRVEQAIEELDFMPNPHARGLSSLNTGGLGIIVPSVAGEFFSELLSGVDETASDLGYYVLISSSHRARGDYKHALASMYGRVDGLVIVAPGRDEYDPNARILTSMPSILVNEPGPGDTSSLGIQNEQGFRLITEHVLSKGYDQLCLIRGPEGVADAQERTAGFQKAVEAFGIPSGNIVQDSGDFTSASGYEAAKRIFSNGPRPTAILAQNDLMALGAMSYLFEIGVRVPEDVVVTGFDDVTSARYSSPPLTTVRVPIRELGQLAIARLHEMLRKENGAVAEKTRLPVELVPRASTGD